MRSFLPLTLLIAFSTPALADFSAFSTGPVFDDFGPVADVDVTMQLPDDLRLRHSFDVSDGADDGEVNRSLMSAARFINMHARAGIPKDRIDVAIVVHGGAVHDVSGDDSGSEALVAALIDYGVRIVVCGQSAAYYDVETEDLLPGVEMALSAMTAHAVLQQAGFTLNPF